MIYFDAGATTLQKPETVARAMYRAVGQLSSPGRGELSGHAGGGGNRPAMPHTGSKAVRRG